MRRLGLLLVLGCGAPSLELGAGLVSTGDGIAVAPELRPACPPDTVLGAGPTGLECPPTAVLHPPGVEVRRDALRDLEARVQAAADFLETARHRCHGEGSGSDYVFAPSSCAVVSDGPDARPWWILGPVLKLRSGRQGSFTAVCPIEPACTGGDGRWSQLVVSFADPDGPGDDYRLFATLFDGDGVLVALDSNDQPAGIGRVELPLGGLTPRFDRPGRYRLEISMRGVNADPQVQFRGARID